MTPQNQHTIEVVAHRGMGSEFVEPTQPPENTLPSFEAAWRVASDACEVDVHLTRDHEVLVIHDESTGRTSGTDLKVADATLAELQELDAGLWKAQEWQGLSYPTLLDVLNTIPDGRRLFVEMKSGPAVVPHIDRAVREAGTAAEQLVMISFNSASLTASKLALPDVTHYLLVKYEWDAGASQWRLTHDLSQWSRECSPERQEQCETEWLIEKVQQSGFDGIDVSCNQPDDFSQKMREAGMEWGVWTVDDPCVALAMAVKGAASITTNRPQYVTSLLRSHGFQTGPVL